MYANRTEEETGSSKSRRWRRTGSKTKVLKIKSRVSSFRRQWSFACKELILSDVGDVYDRATYKRMGFALITMAIVQAKEAIKIFNRFVSTTSQQVSFVGIGSYASLRKCPSGVVAPQTSDQNITLKKQSIHPIGRLRVSDHIFALTVIVNNTRSTVVESRGSLGQRVSSRMLGFHFT
nr:hypothetical protein [Tanacetum cinerariifolium]